jgi:hypothetical protein
MTLSTCKKTGALFLLTILPFNFVVIGRSQAATVSITRDLGTRILNSSSLVGSGLGGSYGALHSLTESFTVTTDTVADTASYTNMRFAVSMTGGGTITRMITTVTPPDFPNLPIINTQTFTETVALEPITTTNLAPQFVGSTVGAITYVGGSQFRFPSNVTNVFPADSFTLSGTYTMQGPTQMVTMPFSVLYSRAGNSNVTSPSMGFIKVGTNFPDTADISSDLRGGAAYRPANRTLFSGTVDGRQFQVNFLDAAIYAYLPIPEPATLMLAMGAALLFSLRRRIPR